MLLESDEPKLLEHIREFALFQIGLLRTWRAQLGPRCVDDIELIRLPTVELVFAGRTWSAIPHGVGVRFRSDSALVDVPFGINQPQRFDSDRVFDYLRSLGLLERAERSSFAARCEAWAESGALIRDFDELGRPVYSLGSPAG